MPEAFPDTDFIPLRWTLRNSHAARNRGGQRLAEKVAPVLCPGDRLYLISHSHGGNVALRALRDPRIRRAASGMVFLGTPFLHVRSPKLGHLGGLYAWLLVWLVIPLVAPPTEDRVAAALKDSLERGAPLADELIRSPLPPWPTFVASVSGDEAGLWLRIVDRATLTPWSLLFFAGVVGLSALLGTWLSAAVAVLFGLPGIGTEQEGIVAGTLSVVVAGIVGFVLGAPPMLLAISRLRGSARA